MKKTITRLTFLLAAVLLFPGRSCTFSSWEKRVVRQQDSVLYVTTLWQDSTILRTPSTNLSHRELQSAVLQTLEAKMLRTVMDPSQDGVGIAAPQVGMLRRIVAVQRFDKEGEPFEVYPNIRVIRTRGEMASGGEGCLSIPNRRGNVMRYQDIDISYTSPFTLRDTVETVQGFTAVIFQHETDHLDGVLYIDKLVEE